MWHWTILEDHCFVWFHLSCWTWLIIDYKIILNKFFLLRRGWNIKMSLKISFVNQSKIKQDDCHHVPLNCWGIRPLKLNEFPVFRICCVLEMAEKNNYMYSNVTYFNYLNLYFIKMFNCQNIRCIHLTMSAGYLNNNSIASGKYWKFKDPLIMFQIIS